MREEILLNGEWGLKYFNPGDGKKSRAYEINFWPSLGLVAEDSTWPHLLGWLPAIVPGDVHSALRRAKVIPDPYFGADNEKCRWVSDKEWWYWKAFSVPPEWQEKGKVIRLVFEGVDYSTDFWANGKYLGHHEGMFSPISFDITDMVNNVRIITIAVCISPPPKNRQEIGGRKCNLGYAIDYAPYLLTMGIWKDVRIIAAGEVYIEDIFVSSRLKQDKAVVKVQIESCNSSKEEKVITYQIKIRGKNFQAPVYCKELKMKLKSGRQSTSAEIDIPEAMLWWPWDRGEQNLYDLEVKVLSTKDESDCLRQTFGIREIKMLKNEGSPEDSFPFTFSINGKKEYIRGTNWTNIDCLHENLKEKRYHKLLSMVKEANINMLRIHGWHIIEKEDFYNLCDEMGILVWQEFSFCNMRYPQDKAYLKKVEEECSQSVKMIRNHPSLTVLCGGNEYLYKENKKLMDILQDVCKKNSPLHPFIPVSDLDRCRYSEPNVVHSTNVHKGDYHNWSVWHELAPIVNYAKDNSLFASEFGVQAVPDIESLKNFIPVDELWPPGYSWKYHFAELYKLNYYAHYSKYGKYAKEKNTEKIFDSLEDFIENSQKAQAEVLKFGIEHYRCRKYRNSGSMFFAFNEPWPAIIGSVVDWYLKPKKAYYAVRDAYVPVLVSLQHTKKEWKKGENVRGEVWIVNDYCQVFKDCILKINIGDKNGNLFKEEFIEVKKIDEDSAQKVFLLHWSIPEILQGSFEVTLSLQDAEKLVISTNRYNFLLC